VTLHRDRRIRKKDRDKEKRQRQRERVEHMQGMGCPTSTTYFQAQFFKIIFKYPFSGFYDQHISVFFNLYVPFI